MAPAKNDSENITNRNVYWLWVSLIVMVLDQASKRWIFDNFSYGQIIEVNGFFNLVRAHNYGAAFSFLADAGGWQKWFFISIGIIVSIAIMIWLRTVPRGRTWTVVGLCLLLGGALGNVIDRAIYGYVIDFFDLYIGRWHWPAFNIADIAITLGALMLISESLMAAHTESRENRAQKAAKTSAESKSQPPKVSKTDEEKTAKSSKK